MSRFRLRAGLLILLVCWAATAVAAPTFPALTGRVVDEANILAAPTEHTLNIKLETLEQRTGRQFVVVTLPSLQGYEIEEYGYQLGRFWGIGSAQSDDGVLLIVAPNERSVRIEVGYGLEPILTDALSSVILNQRVLPRFRAGEMERGVVDGADAIIEQLALPGEEAAARVEAARREGASEDDVIPLVIGLFLLFWLMSTMLGALRPRRRRGGFWWLWPGGLGGSGRGGGGWGGGGGGGGFSGGGGSFGGGGASGGW